MKNIKTPSTEDKNNLLSFDSYKNKSSSEFSNIKNNQSDPESNIKKESSSGERNVSVEICVDSIKELEAMFKPMNADLPLYWSMEYYKKKKKDFPQILIKEKKVFCSSWIIGKKFNKQIKKHSLKMAALMLTIIKENV